MLGSSAPAQPAQAPNLNAFKTRMAVLQSIPASTTGSEAIQLARTINPNVKLTIDPNLGNGDGKWTPKGLVLPPPERVLPGTPEHEFSHELQYLTGVGTSDLGRGNGPYAQYGKVPREITEAAADVMSGTRGYLPDLSPEKRSQAKAIADMALAAGREQVSSKELAKQIMTRKMK